MEITFNLSGREEITTKWLLVKKQEKRGDLNSSFGYSVKSIDIFFSLDTSKGILMHHLGEIHLFELLCLEHGSRGREKSGIGRHYWLYAQPYSLPRLLIHNRRHSSCIGGLLASCIKTGGYNPRSPWKPEILSFISFWTWERGRRRKKRKRRLRGAQRRGRREWEGGG